eukprot:5651061-Amphidinium_carterae.1
MGLHRTNPHGFHVIADADILGLLGECSLQFHMATRQLVFMRKMLLSSDPVIRACTTIRTKSSIWNSWLTALHTLQQHTPSLHHLPHPTLETLNQWVTLMIPADDTWALVVKGLTRPKKTEARKQHCLSLVHLTDPYLLPTPADDAPPTTNINDMRAPLDVIPPQPPQLHELAPPDDIEQPTDVDHPNFDGDHYCHLCFKYFALTASLLSHKQRSHNIHSPYGTRVLTVNCPTCNSQPSTRHELLRHLSRRPECGLPILEQVTPLTSDEYNQVSAQLYINHNNLNRTKVPKRGRIPKVNGVPTSQSITAHNPFTSTLTPPAP